MKKTIKLEDSREQRSEKNLWPLILLFSLVFFVLSSILPFLQVKNSFVKFLSPDENANYIFAKRYQEGESLSIFEKYNLRAEDLIHPRSYFSQEGDIKPTSFLGIIIIYGGLARILGVKVIPFLTPFFASLGLFFFFLLVRKIFDQKIALFSFFLLFLFPVFFYYSSRSLFHNVLFLGFFIIFLYFLINLFALFEKRRESRGGEKEKKEGFKKSAKKKQSTQFFKLNLLYSALAGLFLGLSLAVRASELIWLLPAGLVLLIFKRKSFNLFSFLIFLSFIFLGLLPVFYYNQILYNSPFFTGYNELNRSLEEISWAGTSLWHSIFSGYFSEIKNYLKTIFNTIFYFGFHPRQSLIMFDRYVIKMFWYIFWPALIGLGFLIFKERKLFKKIWPYFLSYLLLSGILLLYYGSWKFVDNPDPHSFTIGNSYTRYWLPIYCGLIILASIFFKNWSDFFKYFKKKKLGKILSGSSLTLIFILIAYLSSSFLYRGSEEGLKYYWPKIQEAQVELEEISKLTEEEAIIITEYHDKFFFPERKVIVGRFNDNNMNKIYRSLAEELPLYYYNFTFSAEDLKYLNERRLLEFGLNIDLISDFNEVFSLYQLRVVN